MIDLEIECIILISELCIFCTGYEMIGSLLSPSTSSLPSVTADKSGQPVSAVSELANGLNLHSDGTKTATGNSNLITTKADETG